MSIEAQECEILILKLNPQRLLRDAVSAGALPTAVHADLVRQVGEWDADWIVSTCARFGLRPRWTIHDMTTGAPPPALDRFDGVFTTGSRLHPDEDHPCVRRARQAIESITDSNQPFFGICLGHQILAQVAGARIGPNQCGPELGVVELTITRAGQRSPLLTGLPGRITATVSHSYEVQEVPHGASLILSGTESRIQALQYGTSIFSVQAHPEADPRIGEAILAMRGPQFVREGRWSRDQFSASVAAIEDAIGAGRTDHQGLLLAHFIENVVVPHARSR